MKISQGNDCNVSWAIYQIDKNTDATVGQIPNGAILFNFSGAEKLVVTLIHKNLPDIYYTTTPVIDNGLIKFDVSDTAQAILGEYNLVLDFEKTDSTMVHGKRHYRIDADGYEIVSRLYMGITVDHLSINSWVRVKD